MKSILVTMLSLLLANTVFSQEVSKEKIDAIFKEWQVKGQPGGALGIFKDGKIWYAKGYGYANLDYDLPNTPTSVFRIASTSKQFTAACIYLLAEQGKLSLEDPLSKFYPDFPASYKDVKVHHLIHHTSGVRDYLELAYLAGMGDDDYYTDEEVEHWLANQSALNFSPGAEHLYSNSGYWLLGQIVGKASGKNMAEYALENIFEPLGMSNTHFHNNAQAIVKNRAYGYAPTPDGFEVSMTPLDMIGDGGIFTTIEDFKKWDDAFYHHDVLSKSFWDNMCTTGKLNNGEDTKYAGGLGIGTFRDKKRISHGGAFVGFRADFMRIPDDQFTIVIFTNRADGSPWTLKTEIADLFYPKEEAVAEESVSTMKATVIPLDNPTLYPGDYAFADNPAMAISITIADDQVNVMQKWNDEQYPIQLTDQGYFILEGAEGLKFTFAENNGGAYQALDVFQQGQTTRLNRVESITAAQLNLNDYVGNYFSKELNCTYQIAIKDEQLVFHVNGKNKSVVLQPVSEGKFSGDGRTLHFNKASTAGGFEGFTLDGGRAKGFLFEKG